MYILLLLLPKNTHSFQSTNNVSGWFTTQYQQRNAKDKWDSLSMYIYITMLPYSLPMCAHTTWNPLTINPMGFPLTTVYNNTLLGKNNSKGKHIIILTTETNSNIYTKIPLKVRQFSPLGTSYAALCLQGPPTLALGFRGHLTRGTLLSAFFQWRRRDRESSGWGHPARR